jgi:hypothetical protein
MRLSNKHPRVRPDKHRTRANALKRFFCGYVLTQTLIRASDDTRSRLSLISLKN